MPKHYYIVIVALLLVGTGCYEEVPSPQKNLSAKVTYQKIAFETQGHTKALLLAIFDTAQCTLKIIDQGNGQEPHYQNLGQAMQSERCVAGCNGGFFQPDYRPLGLLIAQGKRINKLHQSDLLTGVLYTTEESIHLVRRTTFRDHPEITNLLQAGPFLVEKGKRISGLSPKKIRPRTFILHDGKNKWALGYSTPITLKELAQTLADSQIMQTFPVETALNLDGGSSSGFWVKEVNQKEIYIKELARVSNFIGIVER